MKTFGIFLICICGLLAVQQSLGDRLEPFGPRPDDTEVVIPRDLEEDLQSAFRDQPREAAIWGGLLEGMGRFVTADGNADKPLLVTMSDVQRLRDAAILAPLDRVDGGSDIGRILAPYLDKIGKTNEKLADRSRRQDVADLFIGCGQVLSP